MDNKMSSSQKEFQDYPVLEYKIQTNNDRPEVLKYANNNGGNSQSSMIKPVYTKPEAKTYERIFLETINLANTAAANSKQQQQQQQHQQQPQQHQQVIVSTSQPQYKTTVYNINSIDLKEYQNSNKQPAPSYKETSQSRSQIYASNLAKFTKTIQNDNFTPVSSTTNNGNAKLTSQTSSSKQNLFAPDASNYATLISKLTNSSNSNFQSSRPSAPQTYTSTSLDTNIPKHIIKQHSNNKNEKTAVVSTIINGNQQTVSSINMAHKNSASIHMNKLNKSNSILYSTIASSSQNGNIKMGDNPKPMFTSSQSQLNDNKLNYSAYMGSPTVSTNNNQSRVNVTQYNLTKQISTSHPSSYATTNQNRVTPYTLGRPEKDESMLSISPSSQSRSNVSHYNIELQETTITAVPAIKPNVSSYSMSRAEVQTNQSRANLMQQIAKTLPSTSTSMNRHPIPSLYGLTTQPTYTSTSTATSTSMMGNVPPAYIGTRPETSLSSTSPTNKPVVSQSAQTNSPTSTCISPFSFNRPEISLTLKPKISSPAPPHIYGKPDSTPVQDSMRNKIYGLQQFGVAEPPKSYGKQIIQIQTNTVKPEYTPAMQPPPAHSSEKIENDSAYIYQYKSQNVTPTSTCNSSYTESAGIVTAIVPLAQDQILNLDTKSILKHKLTAKTENMMKANMEYMSSPMTEKPSKLVKIEQRVDYNSPPLKATTTEPKYSQNVIWKQQPPVKKEKLPQDSTILKVGADLIEEQKRKILELFAMKPLYNYGENSNSDNLSLNSNVAVLRQQITNMNMELYKYHLETIKMKAAQTMIDPLKLEPFKMEKLKKIKEPKKRPPKEKKADKIIVKRDPFLQNGTCYDVVPKLARCRECRLTPLQRSKDASNIFCRFYAFRKLKVGDNGHLQVAGFADPSVDPNEKDFSLWSADLIKTPADLSVEKAKFLLGQVGYKFCELFHQEKEAYFEHLAEDKTVSWKQAVQGVREMCDVCETTLFNYHWVCSTCGFVVCIDCYKGRKHGLTRNDSTTANNRDAYAWLLCTHKIPHEQNKLMLTQIIPGDCLFKLVRQVHGMCALLEIPLNCDCPFSKESLYRKIKDKLEFLYPFTFTNDQPNDTGPTTTTNMVSVSIKSIDSNMCSTDNSTINCNVTFRREISIDKSTETLNTVSMEKETYSFSGFQMDIKAEDNSEKDPNDTSANKLDNKTFNLIVKQLLKFDKYINISNYFEQHMNVKCQESDSLSDFTSEIVIKQSNIQDFLNDFLNEFVFLKGQNCKDNLTDDAQVLEYNKHLRKYNDFQNKGERKMDLKESETIYQDVAHQWLCDGKLLRLLDPLSNNNYTLFHDQWERGQPVMVSYVASKLNLDLWKPKSFIDDFGEECNDLINCLNGKLIKDQQMKVFWEGFERIGFRLLDERDNPMILKLKDWPPGDDFAEMLPTRYADLMKALPLGEYTLREGRLNLACRLPSFFVRPDLGPKMYNAYGSALHPTKGTTNLHLDVSDAVNIMVYVSVPEDGNSKEYVQKVLSVIETENCDIFTKKRIREKNELPGALWHIFHAQDADKIRLLLNRIEIEKGGSIKPNHDPIHDQKWYLDENLRKRLLQEYNVEGYTIVQCSGDAIFIPAGAPHQVRNLHNCIKVAEDFVSPENVSYCFKLTHEFRNLTNTHSNHEDKLQIKNIIYHTVKDAVSCLTNPLILREEEEKAVTTMLTE